MQIGNQYIEFLSADDHIRDWAQIQVHSRTRDCTNFSYFTRSQDVTLSVHLMAVERKLRGRFGRVFLRLLMLCEKLDTLGQTSDKKRHWSDM